MKTYCPKIQICAVCECTIYGAFACGANWIVHVFVIYSAVIENSVMDISVTDSPVIDYFSHVEIFRNYKEHGCFSHFYKSVGFFARMDLRSVMRAKLVSNSVCKTFFTNKRCRRSMADKTSYNHALQLLSVSVGIPCECKLEVK